MSRSGKCDYPACTGHLGKYPDCVTEALHCSPDWENASTGSTEWDVYAQLFIFVESGQASRETTGMDYDVYIPAGTYAIVTADDRGFVDRTDYPTRVEADNAFREIERAYHRWEAADSGEEVDEDDTTEDAPDTPATPVYRNVGNASCYAVQWSAGTNGNTFMLVNPVGTGVLDFGVRVEGSNEWVTQPVIGPERFTNGRPVKSYEQFLSIVKLYVEG